MSDLIQRLNRHALPDPHDEREVLHAPLLREAAAEIERESGRAEQWEQTATNLLTRAEAAERQRDEAIAALRELVRLEDLRISHQRAVSIPADMSMDDYIRVQGETMRDLLRSQPLAWESARRLLDQKEGT